MRFLHTVLAVGLIAILYSSCAGKKLLTREQGNEIWRAICVLPAHQKPMSVSGSVFLRARSFDPNGKSGQFSADVIAHPKDGLRMQVLNLVGGREAEIRVTHDAIWVDGKRQEGESSSASWAGIPLRFALDLFLGMPPCPKKTDPQDVTIEDGDLLVVHDGGETYRYRVKQWMNGYFPIWVEWRSPKGEATEFVFDDVDSSAHYAKKWEAKSPHGEVKIKWRERTASSL